MTGNGSNGQSWARVIIPVAVAFGSAAGVGIYWAQKIDSRIDAVVQREREARRELQLDVLNQFNQVLARRDETRNAISADFLDRVNTISAAVARQHEKIEELEDQVDTTRHRQENILDYLSPRSGSPATKHSGGGPR
jgi:hypothetical protein